MSNTTLHAVIHNEAGQQTYPAAKSSTAAKIVARLRSDLASPQSLDESDVSGTQLAFLSRCVVLQTIGAAIVAALWIAGLAEKPFQGVTAPLCWIILAIGALGIVCVFLQRWRDVQWLAIHVVRIGLLGTVVGLIIAFSAAASGGSNNPDEIRPMIAAVVSGMYVSLYATLLGIATNLWLKINLRLLGNFHG
jgi:MotA/TolQ/ExbB proton channel family